MLQARKVYVQDRLRETGDSVWQLLETGAHFYVCGDAAGMAPAVEEALLVIIEAHQVECCLNVLVFGFAVCRKAVADPVNLAVLDWVDAAAGSRRGGGVFGSLASRKSLPTRRLVLTSA